MVRVAGTPPPALRGTPPASQARRYAVLALEQALPTKQGRSSERRGTASRCFCGVLGRGVQGSLPGIPARDPWSIPGQGPGRDGRGPARAHTGPPSGPAVESAAQRSAWRSEPARWGVRFGDGGGSGGRRHRQGIDEVHVRAETPQNRRPPTRRRRSRTHARRRSLKITPRCRWWTKPHSTYKKSYTKEVITYLVVVPNK